MNVEEQATRSSSSKGDVLNFECFLAKNDILDNTKGI